MRSRAWTGVERFTPQKTGAQAPGEDEEFGGGKGCPPLLWSLYPHFAKKRETH